MSPALLTARAVEVRYGPVVGVADITMTVGPGELVAVTGPSGAGKTSLLAALSARARERRGHVDIDGQVVATPVDARRAGVVTIPQGNALVRMLTALENVALPLLADRSTAGGARAQALLAMRDVGIDDAADQLVEELSGGQQQRVAVARGLAQPARVLLADGPTSVLDPGNRAIVLGLLRAAADRGVAVVLATHDLEAAALSDAHLALHDGLGRWVRDGRAPGRHSAAGG